METRNHRWPGRDEAKARWGHTEEWEQSREQVARMTDEELKSVRQEHEDFSSAVLKAAEAGITPGSPEATDLVERHRRLIARWYEVSRAQQVLLARMYVDDARFGRLYRGKANYLLELVEAQASKECLDLDSLTWN